MCGIYCVYKQSRSCQLPFCASPIFYFEIGDFSVYLYTIGIVIAWVYYILGLITSCHNVSSNLHCGLYALVSHIQPFL